MPSGLTQYSLQYFALTMLMIFLLYYMPHMSVGKASFDWSEDKAREEQSTEFPGMTLI